MELPGSQPEHTATGLSLAPVSPLPSVPPSISVGTSGRHRHRGTWLPVRLSISFLSAGCSVLCSLPSWSWEVEPVVPVIRELKLRAAIGGQNTNLLGSLSRVQGGRCGDVVEGEGGQGDPSPWELRPHLCCLPQVASKAGVYEILNQLGFPELESVQDQPFSGLRCRWQERSHGLEPAAAGDFL